MSIYLHALLLTRPEAAAKEFLANLELPDRVSVVLSPLIKIDACAQVDKFDAPIFSSRNGVLFAGAGDGRQAYCVGKRTAEIAQKSGFQVQMIGENAADLIANMVSNPPKHSLTHLRGEHSRGNICENLKQQGLECVEQVIYKQHAVDFTPEAKALLSSDKMIIAPLFSPRTAKLFSDQLAVMKFGDGQIDRLRPIALSPEVADQLPKELKGKTIVPLRPTRDMMLQSVARFYSH